MIKMVFKRKAFISMEVVVGILVLMLLLSWIIVFVSKAFIIKTEQQNEALAYVHAQYVINELKHVAPEELVSEVQNGNWNFMNKSVVLSFGLGVLADETIVTEIKRTSDFEIKVTVRWLNANDQYKEIYVLSSLGG